MNRSEAPLREPFLLADETKRRRHVPPIPPEVLRRIFDEDRALNRAAAEPGLPTWTEIAICAVAGVALVLFLFFLDGGWIIR